MEFDLPLGPWKQLFSAQWDGHPVSLQENREGYLLLLLFEEDAGKTTGAVALLSKAFAFKGDPSKALAAADAVFIKKAVEATHSFALVQARPRYAAFEQEALAQAVREAYSEISGATLAGIEAKQLGDASPEERDALLGDPFSLFSVSAHSLAKPKQRTAFGSSSLGKPVFADGYSLYAVTGADERERFNYLRLLAEDALLEGANVLAIDECGGEWGFKQFDKAALQAAGFTTEQPKIQRKDYALGKDLFVNLPSLGPAFFCDYYGFSPEAKAAIVSRGALPESLEELASSFESANDFDSRSAARCVRVIQKELSPFTGGTPPAELQSFSEGGASKLYAVDASQVPSLAAFALLSKLAAAKAKPLPLVIVDLSDRRVHPSLAALLASLPKKGYRVAAGLESLADAEALGAFDRIDSVLSGQAVLSKGGTKARFSPRSPFSR